jgi:photosystem II stability/assembly factor-like uncharacterized protein
MSMRRTVVSGLTVVATLSLLASALVTPTPSGAATPRRVVSASQPTNVNVTQDLQHRYGEPQIAVNPKNPKNVVYAVMTIATTYACQKANRPGCTETDSAYGPQPKGLIENNRDFSQVRVYTSTDAGKTWQRSADVPVSPPGNPALVERGDPLLTVGPNGTFYLGWDDIRFCHCPTTIIDAGGIAISKSTDGGRSWTKPVLSGTPVDRPFFATDQSTGVIYEASTGALGANSKGDPALPKTPIAGSGGDRWLVASRDGVHWSDPKPFGGFTGIGASGDAAHGMYATAFKPTDSASCGGTPGCTVFQTTTDQGATWSRHALPVPGGASASPLVAADPSATGHFTVAVQDTAKTQFLLYQTHDAGATWTGPTTVTDDPAKSHFHPWLAYSAKGVVGLMWQTNVAGKPGLSGALPAAVPEELLQQLPETVREAIAAGQPVPESVLQTLPESVREAIAAQASGAPSPYNVWAAISNDGGTTFTAPLKISTADSPAPQAFLPFGIADDFSFIALSNQYAFVAWADYRPGDRQGFVSAVTLNAFQPKAAP